MAKYPPHPQAIELINSNWKLKLNTGKFTKNLWDSLFDLGDLKAGTATKRVLGSFGKKDSLGNIAFELVFNALRKASVNLINENHPGKLNEIKNLTNKSVDLGKNVTNAFANLKITIDPSFFSNPKGFDFLPFYKLMYHNWLMEAIQLDDFDARTLAKQIPNKFAEELIKEWDSDLLRYKVLKDHFTSNPFSENIEIENVRTQYYQDIDGYFLKPIFRETELFLSTTYINPRFQVHQRNLPKGHELYADHDRDPFKVIEFDGNTIHDYINNYFLKSEKAFELKSEESRLLILLGQPGQGKTSFCFKVIHDTLNGLSFNKELIFIRLRDLANPREFLLHPFDELESHFEKHHFDFDNALLILDGLDELFMIEGLTNTEINEFILQMTRLIKLRPQLHIIITSRFHYVDLKKIGKDNALIFSLAPLNHEEQITWIETYQKVHASCKLNTDTLLKINDEENTNFKEIRELINQPILLYLVAKANFDITKGVNRAIIYDKLFEALIDRNWEKSGQLEKFQNLEKEDFRDFIGAIALKIYHSPHEFIYKSELLQLEEINDFVEENLNVEFKNIEEALGDVLISFYFRNVDTNRIEENHQKQNDYAIEFFHKSLQEYLVAERIWKVFLERFTEKTQKGKYVINKWQDALELIWNIGSIQGLSKEISAYLREIISNHIDESEKLELYERLKKFHQDLFRQNFLYEYKASDENESPLNKAAECFYIFWTVISSLKEDKDDLVLDEHFSNLISLKQFTNYDFFNLDKINLKGRNFSGINLASTNFNGSNFKNANIYRSNLHKSNFSNANLQNVIAPISNLSSAYFNNANLKYANLSYSYLYGSLFHDSDLSHSNLNDSVFINSDFRNANLKNANLRDSDISEAILKNTNLRNTNLQGVNFKDSDLRDADLRDADLRDADLRGADLRGADLNDAILSEAILNYLTLSKVKSLKDAIGIPEEILKKLKKEKPQLFE